MFGSPDKNNPRPEDVPTGFQGREPFAVPENITALGAASLTGETEAGRAGSEALPTVKEYIKETECMIRGNIRDVYQVIPRDAYDIVEVMHNNVLLAVKALGDTQANEVLSEDIRGEYMLSAAQLLGIETPGLDEDRLFAEDASGDYMPWGEMLEGYPFTAHNLAIIGDELQTQINRMPGMNEPELLQAQFDFENFAGATIEMANRLFADPGVRSNVLVLSEGTVREVYMRNFHRARTIIEYDMRVLGIEPMPPLDGVLH